MNPFRRIRDYFRRTPGMVGIPPSARQISADPVLHAVDFSHRYADPLDYHAAQTMLDMGLTQDQIGDSDVIQGIQHAAFHPHARMGGTLTPDGRIILDSGVMSMELLSGEAGQVRGKSRLRSRMEAIIAHELTEHETGSHASALQAAPETRLPIGEGARKILRTMAK